MAAKFELIPNPTFKLPVSIPCAGEADGSITFTFKHLATDELSDIQGEFSDRIETLMKEHEGQELSAAQIDKLQRPIMVGFLEAIASGWDLKQEFNAENLDTLLRYRPAAFVAITSAFRLELWAVRQKP